MEATGCRVGVDLGGTKIEAAALTSDGDVAARVRVPTPRDDYAGTLEAVARSVALVEAQAGTCRSVGIGMPGSLSPATGLVRNANSVWLIGQPLEQDLARRLGRPVRLENDANCFALSEAQDGAGQGHATVFGAILGTGTGGGLVVDGRLWRGVNGVGGEWGHNPLPWPEGDEHPGPACYCGRRGCLETFLSGPALSADHERVTGHALPAPEIVAAAAAGDLSAEATLARYEDRLARSLATVINLMDPAAIVLGGGLSRVSRLYTNVPERWAPYVFSDVVATRLLPPVHGDASGVRGAAWLWDR